MKEKIGSYLFAIGFFLFLSLAGSDMTFTRTIVSAVGCLAVTLVGFVMCKGVFDEV